MSKTVTTSMPSRTAYQRPYKNRQQRREADRRKNDESGDYKFLVRVGVGIVIVVALVLGFALKGTMGQDAAPSSAVESLQ